MKKSFALIKIMLVASATAALCACDKQPAPVEEPQVEVVEETVVEESASEKNQPEVIEPEVTETEEAEKLDETLAEEDIQSLELVEGEEIIEDQLIDDLYYDADIPEDFEFAAHDEDYVEPVGAFCRNLDKLEYLKEPMLFRNDLDAYLIYYIPTIDKEYDTYVISGTEKLSGSSHIFKIRVEGIMEGGQDLEIECRKKDGHKHFDFFSDLSPDGTEEINWGAGLIDKSDFE